MHDIEDMMNLIAYADGSNSLLDIADLIGTPLWKLKPLLDNLMHEELIKKS
jgi:aminopeptidase-like protein